MTPGVLTGAQGPGGRRRGGGGAEIPSVGKEKGFRKRGGGRVVEVEERKGSARGGRQFEEKD